MILADKIIDLRKKNGWSQEELAEKLGVSRQAVSKWESAQAIPDLGRVLAMADLFSVTTDYLLRDENEAPTPAAVEDSAPDSNVRRVSIPQHPYTRTLMSAVPSIDPRDNRQRILLEGDLPSPIDPPSGCVFHTRCPWATEACKTASCELREVRAGHYAACSRGKQE